MTREDRLYELLPYIYRQRDVEQGQVLRGLLRVIAEQINVVEDDIAQLYDNWFIETAEDWVVPYIAELTGYQPVGEAGMAGDAATESGQRLNRLLIPRREVTNTIRYRRRKGTLPLLELLASDVAAWPARAVEFYPQLAAALHPNHIRLEPPLPDPKKRLWAAFADRPARSRAADMREGDALDRICTPFDPLTRTVDVRSISSKYIRRRHNIPHVGLFVWRLKPYSISKAPAYCVEEEGDSCYTFSILGNDAPLFINPTRETDPLTIAGELNVPTSIRRRAFNDDPAAYYGEGKSLLIYTSDPDKHDIPPKPITIPLEKIVPADLSHWYYTPQSDQVAVDPVLGRMVFGWTPDNVWVDYHTVFSDDMGGGEYPRQVIDPHVDFTSYSVGRDEIFKTLIDALKQWESERPTHAVIEITDSREYTQISPITLESDQTLQVRAASGARPTLHLSDAGAGRESWMLYLSSRSRVIFDGLLIMGRGIRVMDKRRTAEQGQVQADTSLDDNQPAVLTIRHCTLVPGWTLNADCRPKRAHSPSLVVHRLPLRLTIDHSITGPIQVNRDAVKTDPQPMCINDSIIDAMSDAFPAIGSAGDKSAHTKLTIERSTVFGRVSIDTLQLAENTIFTGRVTVKRRQIGCVRYSYVEHGSCLPRRHATQPDGVVFPLKDAKKSEAEQDAERTRIRPRFTSTRYGHVGYGQLAEDCADEIKRGADDESEMGAFHDLYQPQRAANLRARLDEYMPAGMDAALITVS
jgi:hypothetical protein